MAYEDALPKTLGEAARLAELHLTGLLDSPPEASFDRLTEFTRRLLGVPISLVSLPDDDRQFFKSALGLGEPWASLRETPLSHSFCRHVVALGEPLVIEDARVHPLVRDNPAIRDLEVVAYLGMPLFTPNGRAVATLCGIDRKPRVWTEDEIDTLAQLAEITMTEIALKLRVKERDQANADLQELNQELDVRVRERTKEVVMLSAELAQAEQAERHRIAQHLHDSLQQELFAAQFALHDLRKQANRASDEMQAATARAYVLVTGAIAVARQATSELNPTDFPGDPFKQSLQRLAKLVYERYGVRVELLWSEIPEPNAMVTGFLLPLIHELLFNVAKHAEVDRATLSVTSSETEVTIAVTDKGRGFDPATIYDPQRSNLGVSSVRDRIARLGGQLLLESEAGRGTRASIQMPLECFVVSG